MIEQLWTPDMDMSDPPFGCPPDIVLDLPPPPSVNKTRRVDWTQIPAHRKWQRTADKLVMAAKCRAVNPIKLERVKRFELRIVVSEKLNKIDLDNGVKSLIDYLRRVEIIENDAPANLRKLTVEWGAAIEGCRVTVVRIP